jgi:ribonuclease D
MRWIDSREELQALTEEVSPQQIFVDTEYDNQRYFNARLALVQVAWDGGEVLIDPLELDLSPLSGWGGDWLSHDGTHDWWLLEAAGWALPRRCLDTQIAARLVGYERFGLAALGEAILGLELDKSEQRSDWLRRPLNEAQRHYAIGDVVHLRTMNEVLALQLEERGLERAWVEESALVLERAMRLGERSPKAFYKLKKLRQASPLVYGRAQTLLDWRFAQAEETNLPEFRVLGDALVLRMAEGKMLPKEQSLKGLLKASKPLEWPQKPRRSDDYKAREKLIKAWRLDAAERHQMDASMVLSPQSIDELAGGLATGEVAGLQGWRDERFNDELKALLS